MGLCANKEKESTAERGGRRDAENFGPNPDADDDEDEVAYSVKEKEEDLKPGDITTLTISARPTRKH
jgi:hypothetical protein